MMLALGMFVFMRQTLHGLVWQRLAHKNKHT